MVCCIFLGQSHLERRIHNGLAYKLKKLLFPVRPEELRDKGNSDKKMNRFIPQFFGTNGLEISPNRLR
jgi:hypothetical protein